MSELLKERSVGTWALPLDLNLNRMKNTLLPFILLFLSSSLVAATSFEGLVQPFREVVISSQVQSIITEQPFREGAVVEKGELLAQLYDRPQILEMERVRQVLEKHEFDNAGAQALFQDRLISEDEALARRIELDLTRLQFEIAEEDVKQRRLVSPMSGILVERILEVGEMVRPGEPLFRIVDISSVYVQTFLSVSEALTLQEGDAMTVTFPELGNHKELTGVVDFLDPRVDPSSGLKRVRILVSNEDQLAKPGLRARVQRKAADNE